MGSPQNSAARRTLRSISGSDRPMFLGPKAMSLYTVSSNSWYSGYCMTMPTRKRNLRICDGSAQMSWPSTRTLPLVGLSSPLKWEIREDFPLPVEPMMPTKSPASTEKLTSSRATVASGIPAP